MKVLLVYSNTYTTLYPPPVGLSLLTEPLRKAGHEVRLVDFMRKKSPDTWFLEGLSGWRYDRLGLTRLQTLPKIHYGLLRDYQERLPLQLPVL
jgi:hypothetical protein